MTEVQAPDAQTLDPLRRKAVSEYERTISTLASSASTRTYLADTPPAGVSGCYDYQRDRIILYPSIEALDTTVIALEEAGHSQERPSYQRCHEATLAFSKKAAPLNARGILDWLEDWRVFTVLEKRFPGARTRFRGHWELRARFMAQEAKKAPQELVYAVLGEIARRALNPKAKAPRTYEAVLREANRLLRQLQQQKQQQQSSSGGDGEDQKEDNDQDETSGDGPDDSTGDEDQSGASSGEGGVEEANEGETDAGEDSGEDSSENGAAGEKPSAGETDGADAQQSEQDADAGQDGGEGQARGKTEAPDGTECDTGKAGASGTEGGRNEIGGQQQAPVPEELAPYLLGVELLAEPSDVTGRLMQSPDWCLRYQRVSYVGRWRTIDGAILEVERP